MIEGRDYRQLDRVPRFVAMINDRSTEHKRTTFMTMVHTIYSEIVGDMTRDVAQPVMSE